MKIEFAASASMSPSAAKVAFTRFNRWDDAWFRYEGGMQNQIWVGDMTTNSFKQVTDVAGTNEYPAWEANRIFFANEKSGSFTLMSVAEAGGKATSHGSAVPFEIRELNSGPGAVIYEKGRGLEVLDTKTNKATPVQFHLQSDLMHTRPYSVPAAPVMQQFSMTPTAQRVFAEARGQILTLPVGEGEARVWKSQPGVRFSLPLMSPDGQQVAYVSDESGEQQIMVCKADGTEPKALTSDGRRQIKMLNWSPDSKWLLYYDSNMRLKIIEIASGKITEIVHSNLKSWFTVPHSFSPDSQYLAYVITDGITEMGQIVIRELATGETRALGSGFTHDTAPEFSSDGKFLVFVSRRAFPVGWDPIVNQMNTEKNMKVCAYILHKDTPNPLALKDAQEPVKKESSSTSETKPEEAAKEEKRKIDFEGIENRLVITPLDGGEYSQVALVGTRLIFENEGQIGFAEIGTKTTGTITSGVAFRLSADNKKLLIGDRIVDVAGKDVRRPQANFRPVVCDYRLTR
ncbi:hypothetical protein QM565_12890 [Geitlerinema splendidum]|nr:hypothetical protein [Geitlerinema splendidum]